MQEAPSSPSNERPKKHQVRFYLFVALAALLLGVWIGLIVMFVTQEEWLKLLFAAFAAMVMAMFFFVYLAPLRRIHANARIEALVAEFDQITDRFIRPKIYRHKTLNRPDLGTIEAKSFLYKISVNSEGLIILPERRIVAIIHSRGVHAFNVHICINDDVLFIDLHSNRYSPQIAGPLLVGFFEKHSGAKEKIAHFKITNDDVQNDVVAGEFSIQGDEFDGFMKTLELAKYFQVKLGERYFRGVRA